MNELKPGSQLTIDSWARRLGIGRTPVREALRRLHSENLVEILPQRSIRVSEIRPNLVRELFAVREMLECVAIRHASQVIPVPVLDWLALQTAGAAREISEGRFELFWLSDVELHTQIRLHCGNSFLAAFLESIHDRAKGIRVFAGVYHRGTAPREVVSEHEAIIDAMRGRDCATANRLIATHMRNTTRRILAQLPDATITGGITEERRDWQHDHSADCR